MKHYILYSVLCSIIILQWFAESSIRENEKKSYEYIINEVVKDRDHWCIRNGFILGVK